MNEAKYLAGPGVREKEKISLTDYPKKCVVFDYIGEFGQDQSWFEEAAAALDMATIWSLTPFLSSAGCGYGNLTLKDCPSLLASTFIPRESTLSIFASSTRMPV